MVYFRLLVDQLLVIALAHESKIFTLLPGFGQLHLQAIYLSQIDACIICSDPVSVQVCNYIHEVLLLDWVSYLGRNIAHFDIKCSREERDLLVQLLHLDVHFLKYLLLGVLVDDQGIYLVSLRLYHLLKRLFILVLIRWLNRRTNRANLDMLILILLILL